MSDFRKVFKALNKASGQGKVRQLAQVRNKLPAQAQESIGTTEPEEAWRLLDKQYGNKSIALMLPIPRIETLRLAHGPNYDKVEAVVDMGYAV